MRNLFKPVDILSFSFISLLGIITIIFIPVIEPWGKLLALYGALCLAIILPALHRKRCGTGRRSSSAYQLSYVVIIPLIFNSLGDLIPSLWHRTFDDILIRIDYALFNVHPTVWMEKMINPAVTTLLQFAYISYYFIPLALVGVLIIKKKNRELEGALFGIVLCFYLSYVGYLLVPAIGPRFTLDHFQTISLQSDPVTQTIQNFLNGLEHNKTDAFPSGHTAVALISLFYCWKCKERMLFGVLLPVIVALIFSTVYLRYHYVIDVIAGVLLTLLTVYLAPRAYRYFDGSPGHPQS